MLQEWLKTVPTNPGLGSKALNYKFNRIFPKQMKVDYTAYTTANQPAAHRWASTWGMTWKPAGKQRYS
ncbi:MAG: hypothetical protein WAP20_00110 [Limnochordia bacterium]|nr:hypothetical protein [Limnochordia bacterium]HQD71787.1 hypothetical protein [Limnochordia bacterium]